MPLLALSWLAIAAPVPTSLPLAFRGGQTLAQEPLHVLCGPLSFSNRYRVRPWPSTSTVPSFVRLVATVVARAAAAGVAAGAEYAEPFDCEPQPAATSATARGTRARAGFMAISPRGGDGRSRSVVIARDRRRTRGRTLNFATRR